jgi:hypothetical protein
MPGPEKSLEQGLRNSTPKVRAFEAKHKYDLEKSKEAKLEAIPLAPCPTRPVALLQSVPSSKFERSIQRLLTFYSVEYAVRNP